ncbi:DNA adenine methylase [Draconibacterium sp.]|uniref:DNA adenine methylase n=1 Tax=Draconibacterium sp. TaxID=1965318 RepID=UPI0035617099
MIKTTEHTKPFLRWAGGKNWLLNQIEEFLPDNFNNYIEPFLGGGSVYIYLKSNGFINGRSYLSDLNFDLIDTYKIIKSSPDALIEDLRNHVNDKDYYYNIRRAEYANRVQKASRFIYLNRTSFNGIYRENLKGEYNVPYGYKQYAELFDFDNIQALSKLFNKTFFSSRDFRKSTPNIRRGDLVFIDPPYTVAHGNNGFVKYNQKIFAWNDQIRLSQFLEYIRGVGGYYIMTNADHSSIRELFSNHGDIHALTRFSLVGGKGAKRTNYKELIITNI